MVKNSQFAANADGVKECSNRKNHRHHGHHKTNHPSQGQGHHAISSSVSDAGSDPFNLFGSFLQTGASSTDPTWNIHEAGTLFANPPFTDETDLNTVACRDEIDYQKQRKLVVKNQADCDGCTYFGSTDWPHGAAFRAFCPCNSCTDTSHPNHDTSPARNPTLTEYP